MSDEIKAIGTADIREFDVYHVGRAHDGFGILIGETPIYSWSFARLDEKEAIRVRAMLEYWCLHLNQAFMAGRLSIDGRIALHTADTWKRLDVLYKTAHGLD